MGSPKEKLDTEEASDEREVYLRDGRKLVIREGDQLVEIRSESGMLELRIRLTDAGPVLQMDAARLQLKASEAVEIEAPRVAINGTEQLALTGGAVELKSDEDLDVEAEGEVHVHGKMIYLN